MDLGAIDMVSLQPNVKDAVTRYHRLRKPKPSGSSQVVPTPAR